MALGIIALRVGYTHARSTSFSFFKACLGENERVVVGNLGYLFHFNRRNISFSTVLCSNTGYRGTDKEMIRQSDQDLLLLKLSAATNSANLLDIVGTHYTVMNKTHSVQALRLLFEYQKNRSVVPNQEIASRQEFLELCRIIKSNSRTIELNETIEILKIISYMGVRSTSMIAQVLLQLIRHNVNELSLQQIIFLDFLLARLNRCALVDALKIALPLVFETQLKLKMDCNNVTLMAEMLHYASRRHLSDTCIHHLINGLTESNQAMDTKTARSIVWTLSELSRSHYVEPLLQQALSVLKNNLHQCTFQEVEDLMRKLVRQIVRKQPHFYDEDFMEACSTYVTESKCNFQEGTWILRKLTRIAHTSIPLLDYLGTQVAAHPDSLERCQPHTILTLVTGMSNADYKPAEWELIRDIILNHTILEEGKLELPWMKFAIELASLGCFSSTLLQRIFQEDFLRQFLEREYNLLDHLQILLLYQSVVLLYPTYMGPLPPADILQKAISLNGDHLLEYPLQGALERGFGGPAYVQTKVYTMHGHCIDHVVVLRKGGFPVAVYPRAQNSSKRVYIEDLEIPADSQIVVVMGFHQGCYSVNNSRLRGTFCLTLRCLESLGHSVVPVAIRGWTALPDHEKIPYLMQNIKLKCDQHQDITVLQ